MAGGTDRFDVVIAGGGFAGVYAARALGKCLGASARNRVALIADHNFMTFQPMLAEVCGSSISPRHVVNPLRSLCRGVTVLRGSILALDTKEKVLSLNAGDFTGPVAIRFNHLALALGGIVDLSRVPGMAEHAFMMKNVGDAMLLRGALIDRFEEAQLNSDAQARRRLLTFVVVGGGYSGVETAGQILDLVADVRRFYPRIAHEEFRVVLIHSRDHLMPEISQDLGIYCEQNMRSRGVELVLGARVTAMTSSRVHLQDGRVIETNLVVSTVGNAPHPLLLDLIDREKLKSAHGRLVVEPTLQVPGRSDLWAAGDCAAIPMHNGSKGAPVPEAEFCPPTAQFAYREGDLLGKNIARALHQKPLKPFVFTGLGELAAIGHRSAVAQILGMKFSGFFAWFLWRTVYLLKLPGLERKLRVMIDWTLDLFFPRDITLIEPRPTEIMKEMHLEKGDHVFHPGEPARSFYIVKTGRIDLHDDRGIVKSLGPGEYFGERALLHDRIWRFEAVASEPTELVSLDADIFYTLSRASDSIHRFFEHSASQYATREQVAALVASVSPHARSLQVADVMCATPITMRPEMKVSEALQIIAAHPYTSFPLLDGDQKPVGLVNQNFLYDALKEGTVRMDSPLKDFTPASFASVTPEMPMMEAVERFVRSGRHKLLVCDGDGHLRGVLTPVDLLEVGAPADGKREET